MKLALYLPNFRDKVTVKEIEDLTNLAEDLNFDSVWTLDRIVVPEASDRSGLSGIDSGCTTRALEPSNDPVPEPRRSTRDWRCSSSRAPRPSRESGRSRWTFRCSASLVS